MSFVNTIPTTEGGTHVAGFERAMTKAVNDTLLANTKKLARLAKSGKDRAEKADVQEGLVAAIKVTFPEPQFRGQTKGELGTPAVQTIVYDVVKDGLADWFDERRHARPTSTPSARSSPRRSSTGSRPARPSRPSARLAGLGIGRHARQAGRLPHPRRRLRAADRRGRLGRRAGQGRAQLRVHGRAARSGARSSTPASPPSSRSSRTPRPRRCSPPSAPARAPTSSSRTPATAASSSCATPTSTAATSAACCSR